MNSLYNDFYTDSLKKMIEESKTRILDIRLITDHYQYKYYNGLITGLEQALAIYLNQYKGDM